MKIPATPETEISSSEDGTLFITQRDHGEEWSVYFAPEIAVKVAKELEAQALSIMNG